MAPDPINDHDLIIRLDERVSLLIKEIQTMNTAVVEKVKSDLALAMKVLDAAKEEAARSQAAAARATADHEMRIRFLERALAWATGALAVAQVALYLILK